MHFDSIAQKAFINLWRTYDRLRQLEARLFDRFELTAQQYNVLRILNAKYPDPVPTLHLAERLISAAPDITRIVDKLEKQGLISRTRTQHDRRSVLIHITKAGRAKLSQIQRPLRQCHEQQLGHLTKKQLVQLTNLLRRARQPHENATSPWRVERSDDT